MNNEIKVRALKECDDDLFPNIYALLKICAIIPAMSCECERSASSLRRLHVHITGHARARKGCCTSH